MSCVCVGLLLGLFRSEMRKQLPYSHTWILITINKEAILHHIKPKQCALLGHNLPQQPALPLSIMATGKVIYQTRKKVIIKANDV